MAVDPPFRVKNMMPGMIMLWYGTYATIPSGWAACDGTMGTPNLQTKYVKGAKVAGPGSGHGVIGGSVSHDHNFIGDGHNHNLKDIITSVGGGLVYDHETNNTPASGTTDSSIGEPPFMTLFYIMKLPIP